MTLTPSKNNYVFFDYAIKITCKSHCILSLKFTGALFDYKTPRTYLGI